MNTIDQLNAVSYTAAQAAAFKVIDALQNFNAGEQVAGAALVFHLLCEKYKQNPRDVMVKGHQVLQDALSFGRGEHINAVKAYLNKEI